MAKADGSTFMTSLKTPLWHPHACGRHCGAPVRSPQEFNSMQLHLPCIITPALPGQDTDELCFCGAHCQAFMKGLKR